LGKSTACSFLHNASDTIGEKKKKKKKKKKKTLYRGGETRVIL